MTTDFSENLSPPAVDAATEIDALRAEVQVLRSRFRALVEAVNGLIWISDGTGQHVMWSNHGGGEDAMIYGSVDDRVRLLHPEDRAKVQIAMAESLEQKKIIEIEARTDLSESPAEYLLIRGVPIFDAQGELTEWMGIAWDVDRWRLAEKQQSRELSLRTQSEQLLRRNNELLHVLAIFAHQLIGIIDPVKLLTQMWETVRSAVSADAYLWVGIAPWPGGREWEVVDRSGDRHRALESQLQGDGAIQRFLQQMAAKSLGEGHTESDLANFLSWLESLLAENGYLSTCCEVIEQADRPVGLLVFLGHPRNCFGETERAFFATVANYLSLAHQRLQARRAAHEQNQRLGLALRSSRMAVCELDLASFQLTFSSEYMPLLGIDHDCLTWEQWQNLIDPRDRIRLQEDFSHALGHQHSFETEFRINRPNGQMIWVSKICEPIFDKDGGLVRYLGTIQDITARKEIEHDLFVKAEHLREAQRIAGLSSYRWDAKQDQFFWSESVDQVHGCGWGSQTKTLADFLQTIHPEERAQVESLLSAALVSHRNFAMEYRSWNPQLQEFQWFAARGRMVLDDHGELLAVEGTCQDVTERRLNEEVLRERDERRRLAVDSVGSVVWMFDPELRVVEVIACAKEWSSLLPKMRFTIAEAIEMLHPDDREAVLPNIHISPDGGQPAKFQVRIVHQDQVRWVSCSANFVRVAADDSLKVFGISQDITEQVNLQEKLAAQNQQLLHAARLSTLGTLTAVMSHELSQPFTAIANFASAAKAVVDSPKPQDRQLLHQYLEKISLQSVRAGSIIRNLRSFSRKSDRELHHTDLTQIIADSLGMLQLELRQRRIRVEWDRSQRNPWLAIDPVQLQQLLINLLTNALDAVEKNPIGQRLIFIGTRRDPENLGIWIEVADNGGGVPAHIQPNLFQPFVCGKAQGTGIGLSICRDIVNNHRGKIEYRPRLGGGAVFAVWFPAEGQR